MRCAGKRCRKDDERDGGGVYVDKGGMRVWRCDRCWQDYCRALERAEKGEKPWTPKS